MANGFAWQTAAPESQGLASERLRALTEEFARQHTRILLIVRGDRIVHEWYGPRQDPAKRHQTASLAKSLVAGLSLVLALQDERLRLDDPVALYIPQWRADALKSRITILHLATHCSGLADADRPNSPGWQSAFLKRERNPFEIARDEVPVLFEPGTDFAYSNPGTAMLGYAIAAAYRGTVLADVRTLLRERIYDPVGLAPDDWRIGYDTTYETDGLPLVPNWSGGEFTARATASLALLMLHKGRWQDTQLLDAGWVGRCVTYANTPLLPREGGTIWPGSGLCWWANFDGLFPELPRDAFLAAGAGHQLLIVMPSLDLLAVRYGTHAGRSPTMEAFWSEAHQNLLVPLMRALR